MDNTTEWIITCVCVASVVITLTLCATYANIKMNTTSTTFQTYCVSLHDPLECLALHRLPK